MAKGCKREQTCSVPVSQSLLLFLPPSDMCLYFSSVGRPTSLVRYLKSVFFVMTFITVVLAWGGYLGISNGLGKDKNGGNQQKSKFACVKGRVSVRMCLRVCVCLRVKNRPEPMRRPLRIEESPRSTAVSPLSMIFLF